MLIFIIALATLVVNSGCVKRMVAYKDSNQVESSIATVQDVKISDDATRVEIATDRPLTYTSYKVDNPPKIVVDLAQTEPGLFTRPITASTGNIKEIKLSRQVFTSGVLTRIEIWLGKDTDFSAGADPVDKGKLLITLAGTQSPADAAPVAPGTVSVPEVVVAAHTVVTEEKPAVPEADKPAASEKNAPKPGDVDDKPVESAKSSASEKPVAIPAVNELTTVKVVDNGVELILSRSVDTFNPFRLKQPERLVLDISNAKSTLKIKDVPINSFGIAKARIGQSPEKIRIVFDVVGDKLPEYEVLKSENGLLVRFAGVTPAQKITQAQEATPAKAPFAPTKIVNESLSSATTGKGTIDSIDFKQFEGNSRISITVHGGCKPGKPVAVPKGVVLTLADCQIPRNLQRSLNTRAFTSPISAITPYQVKTKSGFATKVLVKVRTATPNAVKQEGNTFHWDFNNPDIPTTPKLASDFMRKGPAQAQQMQDEGVVMAPRNELVQEVKTDSPPQSAKKIYKGRKVTLEFSDADIRRIFQLIAEVSNLNFLISDDVTGTISIKLVNVPWDQALDVILDTKNLGMQREGNIVQIKQKAKMLSLADEELAAKRSRERSMELQTEVFDVNYASVSDIATQFNSVKSERGTVSQDARSNRVVVKDIATAIAEMRYLLKTLDIPEKQVMIEARIVEASSNFTRDLGVQWGLHYADGSASVAGISRLDTGFGGSVSAPPTSGTSGPGAAVGMSFGKLASNIQLDLRLSAAATIGQVKIISTPKVVTLNNKAAKISQGQSIPYQTTSAEGTKTEFVEAALTLEVTPHITADGSIGMKIKASNNSPGTGTPPPINKKEATTELLVKNNETTVIGGIYVDSDTDSDTGVPFLQDIPLLGWLFKSNTKTKIKTELLIFITPKIVS
jgi:type IV pilus assembly protein PilQ